MPVTEQDVLSALKSCYDPEIPVNIVDLPGATSWYPQCGRKCRLDSALDSRTAQP